MAFCSFTCNERNLQLRPSLALAFFRFIFQCLLARCILPSRTYYIAYYSDSFSFKQFKNLFNPFHYTPIHNTLAKILGEQTKYWGQNLVKADKCIGVSRFLGGARARASPKVYAYATICNVNPLKHLSAHPQKPRQEDRFIHRRCIISSSQIGRSTRE